MTEVGGWRSEVGGRTSEVGGRRSEVGGAPAARVEAAERRRARARGGGAPHASRKADGRQKTERAIMKEGRRRGLPSDDVLGLRRARRLARLRRHRRLPDVTVCRAAGVARRGGGTGRRWG